MDAGRIIENNKIKTNNSKYVKTCVDCVEKNTFISNRFFSDIYFCNTKKILRLPLNSN